MRLEHQEVGKVLNLNLMNLENLMMRLLLEALIYDGMHTEFLFSSITCTERSAVFCNRILMSEHMAGLGLCLMSFRLAILVAFENSPQTGVPCSVAVSLKLYICSHSLCIFLVGVCDKSIMIM